MTSKPANSLINEKIAQFYLQNVSIQVGQYFHDDSSYNFAEITKLLLDCSKKCSATDILEGDYNVYLSCYTKLLPIYLQSQKILKSLPKDSLQFEWLGLSPECLDFSFSGSGIENGATSVVEHVLLLTAALEHALGNVFYTATEGDTPPHLLRDLLATTELRRVFGVNAIVFMKILLGTPNSINLRNIVWHGFPKPAEIPEFYVAVLLLAVHSLGQILRTQDRKLKTRRQVEDFTPHLSKIESKYTEPVALSGEEQERLISSCAWLSDEHKVFWRTLLRHYEERRYWKFVVLVLPQIELLLRLIYGAANEFDISAKLDEYYITMDTIFEPFVPSPDANDRRRNRIVHFESAITEGALKCLYDLFVASGGPRLRDRVSHGAVTVAAIDSAPVCNILLYLSFHLIGGNQSKLHTFDGYESKFHPNGLTKAGLIEAELRFKDLKVFLKKDEVDCDESYEEQKFQLQAVRIFLRPKKEAELMNLILRISQLIVATCRNYEESIDERLLLIVRHELRSKRRTTLEKLLAAMPEICDALWKIMRSLQSLFAWLQDQNEDPAKGDKTMKFLRHTMKVCENFAKYSAKERNEWIKALKLCRDFEEIYGRYFMGKIS